MPMWPTIVSFVFSFYFVFLLFKPVLTNSNRGICFCWDLLRDVCVGSIKTKLSLKKKNKKKTNIERRKDTYYARNTCKVSYDYYGMLFNIIRIRNLLALSEELRFNFPFRYPSTMFEMDAPQHTTKKQQKNGGFEEQMSVKMIDLPEMKERPLC